MSTAISKNANSAQLYYAKGSVYETGLKDYAQAEEAYKKAVELDPNSAANNFSMGCIYYNQGVSTLDKANSISDATQYKQEKAKAEELFRKALPFFEKEIDSEFDLACNPTETPPPKDWGDVPRYLGEESDRRLTTDRKSVV